MSHVMREHAFAYGEKRNMQISCATAQADQCLCFSLPRLYEPCHEKTGFLHMRKQRRRSALR